ncbi:MAG: hypothetical protein ACI4IQ_06745 [Eubacterium sp.]
MRTSKKLLSFFLAVVMVVTTCSVGFTAFAQNNDNSIWSTGGGADESFDTLNELADTYLPAVLMGVGAISSPIYAKEAKKLGKTELTDAEKEKVNSEVTIQDILDVLSPTLVNLLGSTSKEDFIKHIEGRTTLPSGYEEHYDYLDTNGDGMSFYTLYMLCENYKDNSELDDETRAWLAETQNALEPLANKYLDILNELKELDKVVLEIANRAGEKANDYKTMNLYELEQTDFRLTAEESEQLKKAYDRYSQIYEFYNYDIKIDSVATLIYYSEYGRMGFILQDLLRDYSFMNAAGAKVSYHKNGIDSDDITLDNYLTVLAPLYTAEQAANDLGVTDYDTNPESQKLVDSEVEAVLTQKLLDEVFGDGFTGDRAEAYTDFYDDLLYGALLKSGKYSSRDEIDAVVDAEMPTGGNSTCVISASDLAEIKSDMSLLTFVTSGGVSYTFPADYFKDGKTNVTVGLSSRKGWYYLPKSFVRLDEGQSQEEFDAAYATITHGSPSGTNRASEDILKNYKTSVSKSTEYIAIVLNNATDTGTDSTGTTSARLELYNAFKSSTTATINNYYADARSYVLASLVQEEYGVKFMNNKNLGTETIIDVLDVAKVLEEAGGVGAGDNVELDDSEKYNPNDYDFTTPINDGASSVGVDITNLLLNDMVLSIVQKELLGTTVEGLLNNLLKTPVNLTVALEDVYQRLYDSPVATIVELLPVLTVLLDDLIEPFLLNGDGDQYQGLLNDIAANLVKMLTGGREVSLEAGSYIGFNQFGWDLNIVLPQVLHWLLDTQDSIPAEAAYDYYEAKTVYYQVKNESTSEYETAKFHAEDIDTADLKHYVVTDEQGNQITRDDSTDPATYSYKGNSHTDLKELLKGVGLTEFTYQMTYEGDVPVITGIYFADLALRDAKIADLEKMIFNALNKDNANSSKPDPAKTESNGQLAAGLSEVITELAVMFSASVDEFVTTPELRNAVKLDAIDQRVGSGLNNIFVAIPQLFDIMENLAADKYGVDSDAWLYCYDGKIVTSDAVDKDSKACKISQNTRFEEFKSYANSSDADRSVDIFDCFADIFVGDWLNAILSLVNNAVTPGNKISDSIPLVSGLLEALGGFGEQSIVTDLLNGVFQLTREDKYSFTFEKRDNGFTGLSKDHAYFLITNINTLIEVITNLINHFKSDTTAQTSTTSLISVASKLMGTSEIKEAAPSAASASGYTADELSNVSDLITNLDNMLSSLVSDITVDGFALDEADSIAAAIVTLLSNYLGNDCSSDLVKIINMYLFYINGNDTNKADANGDVDKNKVYTNESLTTIVVETFVLIEDIVENLLKDLYDDYDIGTDTPAQYNLLVEAIEGIISPDTVQIRIGDYADAEKKLTNLDCWHDAVNANGSVKISIDWGIKDGDKDAFFKGLASSLRLVSSILGVLLIDTGWYETIIMPVLDAIGAPDVDTAEEYAAETAGYHDEAVLGIIRPLAGWINNFLKTPATSLITTVQGLAKILDDTTNPTIASIINGAITPIATEIKGVGNILGISSSKLNALSPTFKALIDKWCDDTLVSLTETDESNALVNIKIGKDNNKYGLSGSNLIPIINSYIASFGISLDLIDWKAISNATSPADALVYVLEYLIDAILDNDNLTSIVGLIVNAIDSSRADDNKISDQTKNTINEILDAIKAKKLTAKDILSILNQVLEATDSPTLAFWSFENYLQEKIENFKYPKGITKTMANEAVTGIDAVINNIFPLLQSLGIDLGSDLQNVLDKNLFTNSLLTTLATAVYGALDTEDLSPIFSALGIDVSTAGFANLLKDTSFGATYSSAAKTIAAQKSWKNVKNVNWGFKDGSSNAQQGFVNALVAILRPLYGVLEVFLNEGTLDIGDKLYNVLATLNIAKTETVIDLVKDENGNPTVQTKITYQMKNGVLTLTIDDANRELSRATTIKIDLSSLKTTLKDLKIEGTNGYNSAVIPLLEAFQCSNVKTYAQYQSDVAKAKDNLLLDILNPILGSSNKSLLNKIAAKPVETIATLLPNLAVYIDAHGLSQAVSNLLAPVTEIIYSAAKTLDLNTILEKILGESLGDYVGALLGMDKGELIIDLTDLTTFNLEDMIIPIVNTILAGQENENVKQLKFSNIDWNALISLGTRATYTSKATGEDGKALTGKYLKNVDYGKVLITVLRYVLNNVKSNIDPIGAVIKSIVINNDTKETIADNSLLNGIVNNVIDQIKTHSADQIIAAIYYFFIGDTTEAYWDYTDYITKNFNFSYPDGVTAENVEKLVKFLDGIINELDLGALLDQYLYTDDLINTLANLIYTNIDKVSLTDTIKLGNILDIVGISTSTADFAKLLKDKSYGKAYTANAKVISKAADWSKVDFAKLSWGVKDQDSFLTALAAILRPIDGLLDVLLADGKLNILEGINIPGSNAYESAIVPLLEAFQCTGLKSYEKYLSDKNKATDNLLIDILKPIFGLVDEIIASPVDAIASRLPNIGLFIANNGLVQFIGNLITPITAIIRDINPIIDVERLISELLSSLLGVESLDELTETSITDDMQEGDSLVIKLANTLLEGTGITVPNINWLRLASLGTVKNEASAVKCIGQRIVVKGDTNKVVITLLRYVLDAVLVNGDAIKQLLGNTYSGTVKEIIDLIFGLKSDDILSLVFSVVELTQSPTEVFWCYEYYKELNAKFTYPAGITAEDADNAVKQLDNAVSSVFALLAGLDVVDADTLSGLVNDLLFTNGMVTKLATALYGALNSEKVAPYLEMLGIDVSPKGVAKLLTDKSYGATYSSAAKALSAQSDWKNVKNVNWGFTDGSAMAEQGFVNAVVAVLRPFIDILAPFLNGSALELGEMLYGVVTNLEISTGDKSKGETLVVLKNGLLEIKTLSDGKYSTALSLNLANLETLKTLNLYGSNGYENAIVPFLDAFQVDGIKTYDQYVKDCEKAKDNVLLDVLNPVMSFVDDVLEAPFDTITSVLPNVAYFIDNSGVTQLLDNLLSPVTQLLKDMKKNQGVDIDEILKLALGKDLGKVITDAIGLNGVTLNLELTDLASCNIQDIVVPLINSLLKSKLGIQLPEFKWSTIASHGKAVVSESAAENTEGKFTNKEIIADKGETLVAVLRYLAKTLVNNAAALKDLICGIDAIKNSDVLASIIRSVFNQISTSPADSIVVAVFYLLKEEPTNAFWDYTAYKTGEYDFSYPENMDTDFLKNLPPMLDGLISGLADLNGLIGGALFKDELISKLAVGLYGAIEGVKINDGTNLAQLLAQTDIDFTAENVAKLLVDERYGQKFESAASVIAAAGSWANVNADSLKWGVTDRDSFFHALVAVLRPIYGVLDVLLNDASLGLFDIVRIPGSNGYTSSIVPLMEAFLMYNIKTQYQYREDIEKEYDAILLDIINPIWDKVEDILNAPLQTVAAVLPNLALFIGNDGLCQIIDNLFTPVSALIDAVKPVVDLNDVLTSLLSALNVDLNSLLGKIGITNFKLDLYDLNATLKQVLGADAIIPLVNNILSIIKIKDQPLGIQLMDVDWLQLASHGDVIVDASQAATYGSRIYVEGDSSETLIAVLRFLINTVNYGDNFDNISGLLAGLLGGLSDSISGVINDVLGMLQGDTDEVISSLCDLLQTLGS